jgi:nitroimidazol reductase NimA-like FMN-containing flavoprotein (pyridoxamine 5'-phosphate oxidase superfamily)
MTNTQESDAKLFHRLAKEVDLGHIGMVLPNGSPRVVPVDIVYHNEKFYFHGALSGEKFPAFEAGTDLNLFIYKDYSIVPGDWFSGSACSANHLFESCSIEGHCNLLKDEDEAFQGLLKLVEKFNPEGAAFGETVKKRQARTGTFAISVKSYTTKRNMISSRSLEIRQNVITRLLERGTDLDLVTAKALKEEI